MSMSIPIFFEPVTLINQYTGREHILVDGGMLSNFPVWIFDADEPQRPTIGLKLFEPDPRAPLIRNGREPKARRKGLLGMVKGLGPLDYFWSLVETMMEAHDRLYVQEKDLDQRTIAIDTLGVGTTEFDLSKERTGKLYDSGRTAAKNFLPKFDETGGHHMPADVDALGTRRHLNRPDPGYAVTLDQDIPVAGGRSGPIHYCSSAQHYSGGLGHSASPSKGYARMARGLSRTRRLRVSSSTPESRKEGKNLLMTYV